MWEPTESRDARFLKISSEVSKLDWLFKTSKKKKSDKEAFEGNDDSSGLQDSSKHAEKIRKMVHDYKGYNMKD